MMNAKYLVDQPLQDVGNLGSSGMHPPAMRWPEQTNRATSGWQVNWLDPDRLRARRLRVLRHRSGKVRRAVGQ